MGVTLAEMDVALGGRIVTTGVTGVAVGVGVGAGNVN
jgi:hypothetical protein